VSAGSAGDPLPPTIEWRGGHVRLELMEADGVRKSVEALR